MRYYITDNRAASVALQDIPVVEYAQFYADLKERLAAENFHVAHYFAAPECGADGVVEQLRMICLLLDDATSQVLITSYRVGYYDEQELPSLTAHHAELHPFEREITERYGIRFSEMPWAKPLRFPFDRFDQRSSMDNYPFYAMEGSTLHEVNVGPIHAGIIEPGAFRFICNGERVLHLEIALGYQHRGVEHAFTATQNRLRQMLLSESIAGDSAIAHSTAFVEALEKLAVSPTPKSRNLLVERLVALELERMAMQIADTGALSMDVAYQLGQVACEALRTVTINTTQAWCGNRFGKGLIRPAGTNFPLTKEKVEMIRRNVADVRRRYHEVVEDIKSSPSILSRFEQCGIVSKEDMQRIGGVGQAARASGLKRDLRVTHPWGLFGGELQHESVLKRQGDVMARLMVRAGEVLQSADYIEKLLSNFEPEPQAAKPDFDFALQPSSLAFGLVEGWRGETCHVLITDAKGTLSTCKIKDPSLHNWLGLALAVRGEGISDFPINNKSFNLSYCGHDL